MGEPQLSVVLPCYNESKSLGSILERYREVGDGRSFELILVDNGSRDETPDVLRRLLPRYPFATSVRVEVNQGYGHGLWTGLQAARGQLLAWSHADQQTDPADVFRALDLWQVTTARRSGSLSSALIIKGHRYGRALSERIISLGMQTLASVLLHTRLSEINAQPKLFSRELLSAVVHPPVDFNFDVYVLYQAKRNGWSVQSFPVKFPPRQHGHSHWAATWRSKFRTIFKSMRYLVRLAFSPGEKNVERIDFPAASRRAA